MTAAENAHREFSTQIAHIERQEDDFSELRNGYRRSLERFQEEFHAVARRREASLRENMQSSTRGSERELKAQQELLHRVNRYVDDSLIELERTNSQVRQAFDDERQRLMLERNESPWA